MLTSFVHQTHASRVVFGPHSFENLPAEIDRLGGCRALVVCTERQRAQGERVVALLGIRAAGLFSNARMHVPREIAREATVQATAFDADCLVAIGGGSTIGLAKAVALDMRLPILAIPTTYAGSEMTPIYGITEGGLKKTGTDVLVLPKTVIYDALLTLALPIGISVTSGINAIAHAAEGLYSRDATPITSLLAEEGIGALAESLPVIRRNPCDEAARTNALYGAWLCGSVLGQVGMSLHHKLCHTLGGTFGLPHAETHTVILPHALAYNYRHAQLAMARIERALHCGSAPTGVYALAQTNGGPTNLRELGMLEKDIDRAADLAVANPYWNPRPIEGLAIRSLLQRAYHGQPPQID